MDLLIVQIILSQEKLKDQYKYQIFLVMKKFLSTTKRLTAIRSYGFSEISKFKNNFLSTTNVEYIESMYAKWLQDKNSVSSSLSTYFELLEQGEDPETAFYAPPKQGQKLEISAGSPQVLKQLGVRMMIDRFRAVGHQFAKTDPLDMNWHDRFPGALDASSLNIEEFGFSKNNLQDEIVLKYLRQQNSDKKNGPYTIQAMQDYLKNTYMDKIGYEYMHLGSKQERDFLKSFIETGIESLKVLEPSKEERIETFKRLCRDQCFIDFLIAKFANFKRFGVEGLNAFTSALGKLVEVAAENKVEHIVMGMAHRGRLNSLHCVFEKPAQTIFKEFLEKVEPDTNVTSGDVKYHLGYLNKKTHKGNQIYLSMLPNPSHLEAVDPLVYGTTRAIQEYTKDKNRERSMGVLVHGDAALAGQGIVYESLQIQDLVDYTTGGIIHIVMNNQVGFTTNPWQSRSSYHCTEIAKVIGAPIIHVNADEPDLLDHCMQIAVQYRQKFKKDIFIDIVGYRRFGHNEQDQPFFTQPKMYEKIKTHPSVFEKYSEKCIQTGAMTKEEIEAIRKEFMKEYEEDYKKVMNDKTDAKPAHEDPYYEVKKVENPQSKTGVQKATLNEVFKKVTTWPQDFSIHPTIKKIFEERIKNFTNNDMLDWATMESLAFGTLLQEGYGIRLSGQDVERGTFSHRHALISDQQKDAQKFNFYKTINPEKVTICNSHLSEYGVSGFEYGYSITNPNVLCIWEAQFGDFANGACTIIDNYLVSGESKWGIQSGLVLNLPHGMDGQGPEHSSARLERFLQMSDDNSDIDRSLTYEQQLQKCNMQIVTCSTTSNYFHVLRRQLRRSYRKPLINFNSKKLLKFKGANRPLEDVVDGKEFLPVIGDESVNPKKVKRVLVCNGQFYYELKSKRDELNIDDIAIVRVEQIAPFPHEHLKKALQGYDANVIVDWVQEEHENYGAWTYINPRLTKLFNRTVRYFGRKPSAATAAGALKLHKIEEAELMQSIFQPKNK